jgi:tripartite-type tricarboxylate transporter receptor subunit TctC
VKRPLSSIRLLAAVLTTLIGLGLAPASDEAYPSRPIKIIVPTPPGGVADLLARTLAQKLSDNGNITIVENRSGGAGVVGAEAAAKSPADGYTVYMGLHQTQSVLPHLMTKLPYNPAKDFMPVIHVATSATILVVHPSVPARSVQELVAYAKANPGRVTYASQGNGSLGHIGGALFKQAAGIDIVHVPYRGAAPAIQDLIAGHVSMMFDIVPLAMPQIAADKVRALSVTAPQRVPVVPVVPTMIEAGLPAVQGGPWFGLLVPAGTPAAAVAWLNAETKKVFSAHETHDYFIAQGLSLPLGTPADFAAHIAAETERWGEVIRQAGIRLE